MNHRNISRITKGSVSSNLGSRWHLLTNVVYDLFVEYIFNVFTRHGKFKFGVGLEEQLTKTLKIIFNLHFFIQDWWRLSTCYILQEKVILLDFECVVFFRLIPRRLLLFLDLG